MCFLGLRQGLRLGCDNEDGGLPGPGMGYETLVSLERTDPVLTHTKEESMSRYTKEFGDKVRSDVVQPVAKGAAMGSERLAEGSEAIAHGVRRMADKTRGWADEVTGARRRRNLMWLVLAFTILGAVIWLIQSGQD